MLTNTDKRNALWNSISFISISLLGFLNFSLNYNSFSSNDFGLFILLNAVFGIGNTLDFGFGISTVKYISEARKKVDYLSLNKIFVSFFWSFFTFAIVIVLVFGIYYMLFFRYSEIILKNDISSVNIIFFLLSVSFFFRYLNIFLGKVYEGYAEFVLYSKINLFTSMSGTLFMIIIFILKLHIKYLAVAYLTSGIISFSVLFFIALKRLEALSFNLKYFSFTTIKKYAVYSVNIQISFFVSSFIDPVVKFLIGRYFNLSFVTYYESAKKIIDLTNGLIYSAQKGLFNKLSEFNAISRLSEFINSEIFVYSKMSNYYSILLYGLLNPLLCIFIYIWFRSYETLIIFLIFLLPYSLINFAGCLYSVLMVEGKGIKLLLFQTINLIFISALLFASIKIFNNYLGILGFYLATIITTIILFYFLIKYNGFEYKPFLDKVAFRDLIKLNVLIISELILMFLFKDSYIYILITYFILFSAFFYKYIIYFYKNVITKARNILSYI